MEEGLQLFGGKRRRPPAVGQSTSSVVAESRLNAPAYVEPPTQPESKAPNFGALGVVPWLQSACSAMGLRVPTPVQAACIPPALAGRHVVGCALTGSGKTAAFALPILQALAADPYGVYAVILTPARELAVQIGEQFAALGAPIGVRVAVVVGGLDIVTQGLELSRNPHIVVATPGRLAHHLSAGATPPRLSSAAWLVLDEVDRLLDASMAADLRTILRAVHEGRRSGGSSSEGSVRGLQTLLYSATMRFSPGELDALCLQPPPFTYGAVGDVAGGGSTALIHATAGGEESALPPTVAERVRAVAVASALTTPGLRQEYVFMPSTVKHAYLLALLLRLLGPGVSVDATLAGRAGGGSGASSARHGKRAGRGGRDQPQKKEAPRRPASAGGRKQQEQQKHSRARLGSRSAMRCAADSEADGGGLGAAAAAEAVVSGAMERLRARARAGGGVSAGGEPLGLARGGGTGSSSSEEEEAEGAEEEGDEESGSGSEDEEEEDEAEEGGPEEPPPLARSAILFLSTCRAAALTSELLMELGIPNAPLHAGLPQRARLAALAKFRGALVRVLVATDVASRGLDIPTVDLVVNVDVPAVPSDYIHRVGRTARAGRSGHAVTLVTQYDVELLGHIEAGVLGGARLKPLVGVQEEADVLPRLGRVAVALELAKARLAESGVADALAVKKARRWRAPAKDAQ